MSPSEQATVFFDIDGTLGWTDPARRDALPEWERGLSPTPSPRVANAIRALVGKGHHAFLCTGRSPEGIHPDLAALPFSGMVCLAGGYVRMGGEVLRDEPFSMDLLEAVDRHLAAGGYGALIESVLGAVEVRGGALGKREGTPQTMPEALGHIPDGRAYKLVVRTTAADELMEDPLLGARLTASRLEMGNSEVGLAGNTKRVGIACALAALGERAGTTYGFGDSENDLALFGEVDVAVAMGNAIPEVKRRATYVTDSVSADGVATGLEHFGLI